VPWPPLAVLPLSLRTVRFLLQVALPPPVLDVPAAFAWLAWPTSTSGRWPPTAPTASASSRSWLTLANMPSQSLVVVLASGAKWIGPRISLVHSERSVF
jgi:hypothetical protein